VPSNSVSDDLPAHQISAFERRLTELLMQRARQRRETHAANPPSPIRVRARSGDASQRPGRPRTVINRRAAERRAELDCDTPAIRWRDEAELRIRLAVPRPEPTRPDTDSTTP
jgi:hypothetical protein